MGNLGDDKKRLMQKIGGRPGSIKRAPNPKPTQKKKRGCGCKRNKRK